MRKVKSLANSTATMPKKLSKAGEWRLKNPNGLEGRILDMRAVMR